MLDRDFNAAVNLLMYIFEAGGHSDSLNGCDTATREYLSRADSKETVRRETVHARFGETVVVSGKQQPAEVIRDFVTETVGIPFL